MKVSWAWLSQMIDLSNIEFCELTKKLTLAGFEIENVYNLPDNTDKIIELSITTNRQDASCLMGIAREISTLIKKPLKYNINNTPNYKQTQNSPNISNKALDDLEINIVKNINNSYSPKWLQSYLQSCDIKTTHLINDIQEYIKIKWGQDIEIFDTNKLDKSKISNSYLNISKKGNINRIIEIKNRNKQNKVQPELLKYKDTVLSIIGIKSNDNIICDINTSNIMVCATICKPKYIQKITKQLNIKTKKSIQHTKKILRYDFQSAYNETIQLISTFGKGTTGKSYTYHELEDIPQNIIVKQKYINGILGPTHSKYNTYLSVQQIEQLLCQLKFQPIYNNIKKTFHVSIPRYRIDDIKRPIDVIEEIGRIYGFEKFHDTLPANKIKGITSKYTKNIKKIRKILRDFGLHEVIHYSLKNQNAYQTKCNIKLFNPLIEDQSVLQDNLLTNLVHTQEYNIKHKNFNTEAFEIGRVFKKNSNSPVFKDYKEDIHISCLTGKSNFSRQSWEDKAEELKWFQAKGMLEEFLEKLQSKVLWKKYNHSASSIFKNIINKFMYSKRTAIIYNPITQEEIGIFGQLNSKHNTYSNYMFEIKLSCLEQTINNISHLNCRIKPYSPYPSVSRDISVKLYENEDVNTLHKKILNKNNSLLESIEVFNEYKQKDKNNNTYRNIGLRITYRSNNRTLNEIDLATIDRDINYLLNT